MSVFSLVGPVMGTEREREAGKVFSLTSCAPLGGHAMSLGQCSPLFNRMVCPLQVR